MLDSTNDRSKSETWEIVTLDGGPFSGQTMHVPTDQAELVLYDDAEPHRYYRATRGPRFIHWSRIQAMFGGGR